MLDMTHVKLKVLGRVLCIPMEYFYEIVDSIQASLVVGLATHGD